MIESEKVTRKQRIDTALQALDCTITLFLSSFNTSSYTCHAVEEYPTSHGPADYALFVQGKLIGILEAKKHGIGAQNVLSSKN